MANNEKEKITKIFNSDIFNNMNTKLARRLFILIFAGILFIMLGNLVDSDQSSEFKSPQLNSNQKNTTIDMKGYQQASPEVVMEEKLRRVLSNLSGVGKVAVDITLDTGSEYLYAKNNDFSKQITNEEATDGGERRIEQKDQQQEVVIIRRSDGSEKAVVRKEIKPKIKGVLVVAQGAESSYVKADLVSAVKVGLGVPAYKIVILPMKR